MPDPWERNLQRELQHINWLHEFQTTVAPELYQDSLLREAFASTGAGNPPQVLLAGYLESDIRTDIGGTLTILAWVTDPEDDTSKVELLADSVPIGIEMKDDGSQGDTFSGDHLYTFQAEVPGGAATGDYLLEIRAEDLAGNQSGVWPNLTIFPGGPPTPTQTPTPTATPSPHPGNLRCDGAILLECGVKYVGDTTQAASLITNYNCQGAVFNGREVEIGRAHV